jgi:hypothetical protein
VYLFRTVAAGGSSFAASGRGIRMLCGTRYEGGSRTSRWNPCRGLR